MTFKFVVIANNFPIAEVACVSFGKSIPLSWLRFAFESERENALRLLSLQSGGAITKSSLVYLGLLVPTSLGLVLIFSECVLSPYF